jgi:iodotyrosine deiodinase
LGAFYLKNKIEIDLIKKSENLLKQFKKRRTVRFFSKKSIPRNVIENCISIAGTAPSGANMQPWTFVLVENAGTKKEIREKAEDVEKEFYSKKITVEWKEKLHPLKTGPKKEFLTQAAYLICIFVQRYGIDNKGKKVKHYYPVESVGIATGILISALHQLGLSSLTYTPAPMNFISEVLHRPKNEKPFLILAVGYPSSIINRRFLKKSS